MLSKTVMKDCLGEDRIVYHLPVTEKLLAFLETYGQMQRFDDFPFFRMDIRGKFRITGIVGGENIKVTYKRAAPKGVQKRFESKLETLHKSVPHT